MENELRQYGDRNIDELDDYYLLHTSAMTSEKLHSKSDIAVELAYRDKTIDDLKELLHQIILTEDNYTTEDDTLGEIYNMCRDALN